MCIRDRASFAGTLRAPTNIHQSPAWSFMRTHGNGARVKSTVFVSTRAAVIGRATVGRTGKMVPQAVRVSFRGRLSWRPLSFQCARTAVPEVLPDQYRLFVPGQPIQAPAALQTFE